VGVDEPHRTGEGRDRVGDPHLHTGGTRRLMRQYDGVVLARFR
jgi:hypothetical protein